MLLGRVISFCAASLTFGTLALASPTVANVDLAKRDISDIEEVLTTLKTSTDSILPQIQDVATSGNATEETLTPLINDLVGALDVAAGSLSELPPVSSALSKRQTDDEIANLVASIIDDITTTLDIVLGAATNIPNIGFLFVGIDTSLAQVLLGLEILLAGVLRLVANLYVLLGLAGLLNRLAFGLTLGALGL